MIREKVKKFLYFPGILICAMIFYHIMFTGFGGSDDQSLSGMDVWAASSTSSTSSTESTTSTEATESTLAASGQTEPADSDLILKYSGIKLRSKRWIQSFTMDNQYYYFVQMTNPYKGHLRITRVKYKGLGKYSSTYMDLKYFGHGTNLDSSLYKGKTYLWIGSDSKGGSCTSTSISCFQFKSYTTLSRHAAIRYKIPRGKTGSYATNVYPAVSGDSKTLTVRYTYKKKQYFQFYTLSKGRYIKNKKYKKRVCRPATKGDFQGFDIRGTTIYTIEGSPCKAFLLGYDKTRVFQPMTIRYYNYKTKASRAKVIKGAAKLSFREPEGIEVTKAGRMEIMIISDKLEDQTCNIYQVK